MLLNTSTVIVLLLLVLVYFSPQVSNLIPTAEPSGDTGLEPFNSGYRPHSSEGYQYSRAMRSFGRTAHLNEAEYSPECNPHGIYYVQRYNKPCAFKARRQNCKFPYEYGLYNACGKKTTTPPIVRSDIPAWEGCH